MTQRSKPRLVLRLLLLLYPRRFRQAYGDDLTRLHQHLDSDTRGRFARYWRPILDTLIDAPAAHWAEWRRDAALLGAANPTPARGRRRMALGTFADDLAVAGRSLSRRPGWTCLVVATLSIGLGGVAAIWTVVDDVLLQPLPYAEPDRLLQLVGTDNGEVDSGATVAYLDVMDWHEQSKAFANIAAYDEWNPILTGSGDPVRLVAALVNTNFFEILGVEPAEGRFFLPEEDIDGNDRVVVLDHGLWVSRFGADAKVVGQQIVLNGNPHTVVGVTRASFEDLGLSGRMERPTLWRPLGYRGVEEERLPNRGSSSYVAIGRLEDQVSIESAQAEIGTIAARLEMEYPRSNTGRGVLLVPIRDRLVGDVQGSLVLLLIAMGCLLTIALLNIANLTLERSTEREGELAVRASLGASRVALLRPALAEGLLFGLLGGCGALLLARPMLQLIVEIATSQLPRAERVAMSVGTGTALLVLALTVGALCSTLPALKAAGGSFRGHFRSRASAGRSALRLRGGLIAAEVALALVLLSSGAVLARSLLNLHQIDAGIEPNGVLTFDLSPPRADYPDVDALDTFYHAVTERLAAINGVDEVAAVNIIPLSGGFDGNGMMIPGQPSSEEDGEWSVQMRTVTPGYFRAIGTRLLEGRGIEATDRRDGQPVVVINQSTSQRFFPQGDAVGSEITVVGTPVTIVGVVADTKHLALDEPVPFQAYVARDQGIVPWQVRRMSMVLRVDGDPLSQDLGLVAQARAAVWALDDKLPLANLRSLQQVVNQTVSRDLLRATLVGAFALIAIVLSLIGCYGVTAYAVTLRRRELALRMALGARQLKVLGDVVRQAARPAGIGLLIGIAGSYFAVRLLGSFLHGVNDASTVGLALAPLFLAVVVVASLGPARRATLIEPMTALREE